MPNCDVVSRVSQRDSEEPNVYRLRVQPLAGALVERNGLVDDRSNHIFRSAGAKNLIDFRSL